MDYNEIWTSGSNEKVSFSVIVNTLKNIKTDDAKIFIGTDSFVTKKKIIFASAICVHGPTVAGKYFFIRKNEKINKFSTLVSRITEETHRSVQVAECLIEDFGFNPKEIELHLDVSPFNLNNGTSKFSDMLKGYVSGYGFSCKIKPNAWASQTIADRHSK